MGRKIVYGFLGCLLGVGVILFFLSVYDFTIIENEVFGVPVSYINIAPIALAVVFGALGIYLGVKLAKKVNREPKEKIDPLKPKMRSIETILFIATMLGWIFWDSSGGSTLSSSINRLLLFAWLVFTQSLYYGKRRLSTREKASEEKIKVDAHFLSKRDKILVWIFGLFSPPAVGLISYFLWQKKNYLKARQANLILLLIFVVEFVVVLGYVYLIK